MSAAAALHRTLLFCSHTVLGVDQSFIMLQPEIEDKSDVIDAASDLVGVRRAASTGCSCSH
jgi:hypothetical protein